MDERPPRILDVCSLAIRVNGKRESRKKTWLPAKATTTVASLIMDAPVPPNGPAAVAANVAAAINA
jgi:hypothetical protein